ncbi:MAG: hypothetical protein BroJett033_9070 [Chloroflexota bacterium]|nr:MAG: hypothetical protein BroJett033_9070 [Chloroflexota bacterium]
MRSDLLARALLAVALIYGLTIGGTYNGLVEPRFRLLSLAGLALLAAAWLLARWRGGWRWHWTPLDAAAVLWTLAFGLSLAANQDAWRRIAIGLWYMGLYAGLWFLLLDVLANRRLSRAGLVDALLLAGLIVLIFGYMQIVVTLSAGLGLPRPVSTLGNPNTLAAVLVALLPLAAARAAGARTAPARALLAAYALAVGVLLVITRSRGAWIGAVVGLAVLATLLLARYGLLSPRRLRAQWAALGRRVRAAVAAGALLALLVAAGGLVYLFDSLDDPGRDIGLRTYLWEAALAMGGEKPLTGQGLFTFGRNLARYDSIPPRQPQAHAHNAPLQIVAELGLAGAAAAVVSLALILTAAQRNWRRASPAERILLAGAGGGAAAFGAHHLLDLPAMAPAVALVGLATLAALAAPVQPVALRKRVWRWARALILTGLWAGLVVSGAWATTVYSGYLDTMRAAVYDGDYRAAAARLGAVIAAEPDLALYHGQRAYLLGLAARAGDGAAATEAAAVYGRASELDPYYAPYHANQAALLWNSGQLEAAFAAQRRAVELAPASWQLNYTFGLYAEALGRPEIAAAAYDQALAANPDADLYPAWGATELQTARRSRFDDRAPLAQAALLLEDGQIGAGLAVWENSLRGAGTPAALVTRALLELAIGNRDAAVSWLAQAEAAAVGNDDDPWLLLGAARLARFDGDAARAADLAAQARAAARPDPLAADDPFVASVAYAQYHRQALERYFLPQVYYPTADAALVYLLNRADPSLESR